MKNIFLKIYLGMLLTALVIMLALYSAAMAVSRYRVEAYVEAVSPGFFQLVSLNLSGKAAVEQYVWLERMEAASGLEMNLISLNQLPGRVRDELLQKQLLVKPDTNQRVAQVFFLQKQTSSVLTMELHSITEELGRGLAFLLVNEISNRSGYREMPQLAIYQLGILSPQSQTLRPMSDFSFDLLQQSQLENGELMVGYEEQSDGNTAVVIYAMIPGQDELLVIGPETAFDWEPLGMIVIPLVVGAVLFGLVVYLLLIPLQRRLQRIEQEILDMDLMKVSAPPMTVEGNDMLGFLAMSINLMAERIAGLIKMQRELTQAVSHELRSPLARIKFHLALLEDLPEPDRKEHFFGIRADLFVLEQLVDEILTLAHLERDEMSMNFSDVAIVNELQQLFEELGQLHPGISLELENPERIFLVYADAHYLMRACHNVVINALRHAKSRVVVTLHQEKNHYLIRVQDDGEGINDEDKKRVFEPFTRLDFSRNRKSGGYGLGLAIVFQIMRWHRGKVELFDSPLGGCEFRLRWLNEHSLK